MSDEKWVTLTPEQVEALEQGVIVRAYRGDVTVQGPLDNVDDRGTVVGIGSLPRARFYIDGPVEVREQDVPELDPQRLVSVRADDLEVLVGYFEPRFGVCDQACRKRIRAALRGETS